MALESADESDPVAWVGAMARARECEDIHRIRCLLEGLNR